MNCYRHVLEILLTPFFPVSFFLFCEETVSVCRPNVYIMFTCFNFSHNFCMFNLQNLQKLISIIGNNKKSYTRTYMYSDMYACMYVCVTARK